MVRKPAGGWVPHARTKRLWGKTADFNGLLGEVFHIMMTIVIIIDNDSDSGGRVMVVAIVVSVEIVIISALIVMIMSSQYSQQ